MIYAWSIPVASLAVLIWLLIYRARKKPDVQNEDEEPSITSSESQSIVE